MVTKQHKDKHLKKIRNDFEKVRDSLGKPIDEGILETVVLLNAVNISTLQSCQGHLDHGVAAPWIDISAEQTVEQKNLWKKYHELRTLIDTKSEEGTSMHEMRSLFEESNQIERLARKPILKVFEKVLELLSEFYGSKNVPLAQRLILTSLGTRGRIESQGGLIQETFDPQDKQKNLLTYQKEMQKFTTFLKAKHLSA